MCIKIKLKTRKNILIQIENQFIFLTLLADIFSWEISLTTVFLICTIITVTVTVTPPTHSQT